MVGDSFAKKPQDFSKLRELLLVFLWFKIFAHTKSEAGKYEKLHPRIGVLGMGNRAWGRVTNAQCSMSQATGRTTSSSRKGMEFPVAYINQSVFPYPSLSFYRTAICFILNAKK